jgi:hypothetical protein
LFSLLFAAVCIVGVAVGITVPFVLNDKPNGVLAKEDATNTSSPNGTEIEGVGWMETYLIFVRSNSRRLFRKKKTVAVSNNNQYIVGGGSRIVRIYDRLDKDWQDKEYTAINLGDEGIERSSFVSPIGRSGASMQILVGADGFVAMFGHHTIHADTVTGPITSYSWMFEGMVSGPTSSECFDRSLALSKNGSMVAIGDEFYDAAGKNNTGQVQVYRYENPDFVAVGKLLMGGQGAYFGWAIAVNENGTMLVVGAAHQNFNDDIPIIPGYVRTFI